MWEMGFDSMKYGGVHDCLFAILLYPDLLIDIRWSIHVKCSQMSTMSHLTTDLGVLANNPFHTCIVS